MQQHTYAILTALLLASLAALQGAESTSPNISAAQQMARYNVVWNSPSKDASGVMPIGNGDLGAGVYAIENGDLFLLLSKNDAYNYMGDLFKTGRLRITLKPNPFESGKPFRQTLDLASGSIKLEADGVAIRIWADANRPIYHVEIHSPHDLAVTAQPDLWRRIDNTCYNKTAGYTVSAGGPIGAAPPQDVRLERQGNILWYFTVGDHSVYPDDLKYYDVESMAAKFPDPYRFNTFGNLLGCREMKLKDGTLSGTGTNFDIQIQALTMQTPKATVWIKAIEKQAAKKVSVDDAWKQHCAWWSTFWNRSWIIASDHTQPSSAREQFSGEPSATGHREEADGAALVSQSYNVFRFLMACQSRGKVQTKFNGGIFTQPLHLPKTDKRSRTAAIEKSDGTRLTHEDDRLWGRRFTFQNQRLLYWPLLASGDYDLMKPFFDYYSELLPMRTAMTKAWFGHAGAYYRENIEPDGAERDCGKDGRPPKTKLGEAHDGWYHDFYFTSGLEATTMMLDYVDFTGDTGFRDQVLVPFARQILLFFDQHYPRGTDGKLRIEPGQVVETWWTAVNPTPDIAGLRFCLDGLIAMKAGTVDDQSRWIKFRAEIPEVPMQVVADRQAIAPAQEWSNKKKQNDENGELYSVFPFRCFGLGLGTSDLVAWTMEHRANKDAFGGGCWTQDQIHWAYAGRAAEVSAGLVQRFRIASPLCRFPLYGSEGPDSCPDFDHFGAGAVAFQRMIVQETGEKIFLLPAWPADWDANFKLHLTRGAVITGTVKDGKLSAWDITPESRKKDVIVSKPQAAKSSTQL